MPSMFVYFYVVCCWLTFCATYHDRVFAQIAMIVLKPWVTASIHVLLDLVLKHGRFLASICRRVDGIAAARLHLFLRLCMCNQPGRACV